MLEINALSYESESIIWNEARMLPDGSRIRIGYRYSFGTREYVSQKYPQYNYYYFFLVSEISDTLKSTYPNFYDIRIWQQLNFGYFKIVRNNENGMSAALNLLSREGDIGRFWKECVFFTIIFYFFNVSYMRSTKLNFSNK